MATTATIKAMCEARIWNLEFDSQRAPSAQVQQLEPSSRDLICGTPRDTRDERSRYGSGSAIVGSERRFALLQIGVRRLDHRRVSFKASGSAIDLNEVSGFRGRLRKRPLFNVNVRAHCVRY
jgi:hypothetical protein